MNDLRERIRRGWEGGQPGQTGLMYQPPWVKLLAVAVFVVLWVVMGYFIDWWVNL